MLQNDIRLAQLNPPTTIECMQRLAAYKGAAFSPLVLHMGHSTESQPTLLSQQLAEQVQQNSGEHEF